MSFISKLRQTRSQKQPTPANQQKTLAPTVVVNHQSPAKPTVVVNQRVSNNGQTVSTQRSAVKPATVVSHKATGAPTVIVREQAGGKQKISVTVRVNASRPANASQPVVKGEQKQAPGNKKAVQLDGQPFMIWQ